MPQPRTQIRVAERLFLRLYAANLSRGSRNDPGTACGDAVLQLAALSGIVSTTVYIAVGIAVASPLLRHMYAVDWTFLVIAAAAGGVAGLWGGGSLGDIRTIPALRRHIGRERLYVQLTFYTTQCQLPGPGFSDSRSAF